MALKEAVKTYIKAKRVLRAAEKKVAKSKSRITSNEEWLTACFYKNIDMVNLFFRSGRSPCFGNTADMKPSVFCKDCGCYSQRLIYEKNCLEVKKYLENKQRLKQELIDAIKKELVKSK